MIILKLFSPSQCCNALQLYIRQESFYLIPEGGTIVTSKKLIYSGQSKTSINALSALVKRFEENAQSGYEYFRKASEELNKVSCDKISKLSFYLLNNMDYSSYLAIRENNLKYLNSSLKSINILNVSENSKPLCYPLMLKFNVSELKKKLIENKIYVATYWDDAISRIRSNSFESKLIFDTLYIPLDQRYNLDDLDKIVKIIKGFYDEK
ncbi:hypothetical protein [Photobacterium leiognathi]|uniref:hypothetical protein n=1 Tax=Photobacterium leiognathi TaxID=553611 RepID=UPI002733DF4D|nr:hypothetical protein [Photobacterium leiognathi]